LVDGELGLLLVFLIDDPQFDVLRTDPLLERHRGASLVVPIVRPLAGEEGHQFMVSLFDVADVEALHATALEGLDLARRVEITCHCLASDLELDRVELEKLAHVH